MFRKIPLLLLGLLMTCCQQGETQVRVTPVAAAAVTGVAVSVIDGDTFDLLAADGRKIRIRLHGIDCPERGQPYYKVCKTALSDLCNNRKLKVVISDTDPYKRSVGDIYTEDGNWINLAMVAGGYAWYFARYSNDSRLAAAEQAARKAHAGLWRDANPTAPWAWRKSRRNKKTAAPKYYEL